MQTASAFVDKILHYVVMPSIQLMVTKQRSRKGDYVGHTYVARQRRYWAAAAADSLAPVGWNASQQTAAALY